MKKYMVSNLFLFSGILWIFGGIISEDLRYPYLCLGFAFITLGLVKRKKDSTEDRSEVPSTDKDEYPPN